MYYRSEENMNIFKYNDDVNTDMLFPGKYTYTCTTPEEIKLHLFEDLDPTFIHKVKEGDIIFAGKNFGCGSSREQPVIGLKAVGIKAIIAKSFARIFYRCAINHGLVLIECANAVDAYKEGDEVELKLEEGKIIINEKVFFFPKLPPEILAIRDSGGLLEYTRKKLKERKK
jgi:3-isopropylmalate/(R)-2-methylmalate dehydratase small subunit